MKKIESESGLEEARMEVASVGDLQLIVLNCSKMIEIDFSAAKVLDDIHGLFSKIKVDVRTDRREYLVYACMYYIIESEYYQNKVGSEYISNIHY